MPCYKSWEIYILCKFLLHYQGGVTSFCGEGVNFQKNGGYLKSPDPIDARIRQCTCSFSGLSPGSASVHLNLVYQDYDTKEQNIEVFYNNDGNPVAWSNAEYTPSLVMYGDFHVKFTNDQKSSGGNVILRYTGTGMWIYDTSNNISAQLQMPFASIYIHLNV